jgi:hypothetical protein
MAKKSKDPEYDLLETLNLLIELREDMEDLGITTIAELDERIRELESQLQDDDESV